MPLHGQQKSHYWSHEKADIFVDNYWITSITITLQCRSCAADDGAAKCAISDFVAGPSTMPNNDAALQSAFPSAGRWTDAQLKLAFSLYCQIPFGKLHHRNSDIVELAGLISRTPSALAMKLSNFASLDPSITRTGRRGLSGASAKDRAIWDAFHADWGSLAVECEKIRRGLLRKHGKPSDLLETDNGYELDNYIGETRRAISTQRIKQNFFRRAVLASYGGRCCISGVSDPRLLIASHIVAWSDDEANRLNPSNGLCLSAIHDRAFDQHMLTLSDDRKIILSKQLLTSRDSFIQEVFWPTAGRQITLPDRFLPNLEFIRKHREITVDTTR